MKLFRLQFILLMLFALSTTQEVKSGVAASVPEIRSYGIDISDLPVLKPEIHQNVIAAIQTHYRTDIGGRVRPTSGVILVTPPQIIFGNTSAIRAQIGQFREHMISALELSHPNLGLESAEMRNAVTQAFYNDVLGISLLTEGRSNPPLYNRESFMALLRDTDGRNAEFARKITIGYQKRMTEYGRYLHQAAVDALANPSARTDRFMFMSYGIRNNNNAMSHFYYDVHPAYGRDVLSILKEANEIAAHDALVEFAPEALRSAFSGLNLPESVFAPASDSTDIFFSIDGLLRPEMLSREVPSTLSYYPGFEEASSLLQNMKNGVLDAYVHAFAAATPNGTGVPTDEQVIDILSGGVVDLETTISTYVSSTGAMIKRMRETLDSTIASGGNFDDVFKLRLDGYEGGRAFTELSNFTLSEPVLRNILSRYNESLNQYLLEDYSVHGDGVINLLHVYSHSLFKDYKLRFVFDPRLPDSSLATTLLYRVLRDTELKTRCATLAASGHHSTGRTLYSASIDSFPKLCSLIPSEKFSKTLSDGLNAEQFEDLQTAKNEIKNFREKVARGEEVIPSDIRAFNQAKLVMKSIGSHLAQFALYGGVSYAADYLTDEYFPYDPFDEDNSLALNYWGHIGKDVTLAAAFSGGHALTFGQDIVLTLAVRNFSLTSQLVETLPAFDAPSDAVQYEPPATNISQEFTITAGQVADLDESSFVYFPGSVILDYESEFFALLDTVMLDLINPFLQSETEIREYSADGIIYSTVKNLSYNNNLDWTEEEQDEVFVGLKEIYIHSYDLFELEQYAENANRAAALNLMQRNEGRPVPRMVLKDDSGGLLDLGLKKLVTFDNLVAATHVEFDPQGNTVGESTPGIGNSSSSGTPIPPPGVATSPPANDNSDHIEVIPSTEDNSATEPLFTDYENYLLIDLGVKHTNIRNNSLTHSSNSLSCYYPYTYERYGEFTDTQDDDKFVLTTELDKWSSCLFGFHVEEIENWFSDDLITEPNYTIIIEVDRNKAIWRIESEMVGADEVSETYIMAHSKPDIANIDGFEEFEIESGFVSVGDNDLQNLEAISAEYQDLLGADVVNLPFIEYGDVLYNVLLIGSDDSPDNPDWAWDTSQGEQGFESTSGEESLGHALHEPTDAYYLYQLTESQKRWVQFKDFYNIIEGYDEDLSD